MMYDNDICSKHCDKFKETMESVFLERIRKMSRREEVENFDLEQWHRDNCTECEYLLEHTIS